MPGTSFSAGSWSGYDEQSWTNPDSAQTDHLGIINIANLSSDLKSNVQSDGADLRITKGDGTTELPIDVIDWSYNAGSPTGHIVFKWTGTLAASGTQNVRVYAGYTGGTATAYDASETYGSDNAYDSSDKGYWPLSGTGDRTSNGNTLTAGGGVTVGGATGKVGGATEHDGNDDYLDAGNDSSLDNIFDGGGTVEAWIKPDSGGGGGQGRIYAKTGASNFNMFFVSDESGSDLALSFFMGFSTTNGRWDTTSRVLTEGVWNHVAVVYDADSASNDPILYVNGSSVSITESSTPSGTRDSDASVALRIGNSAQISTREFDGVIDELRYSSSARSADNIASRYAQTNDNATFWGTWAWTSTPTIGHGGSTECYNNLFGLASHSDDANFLSHLPLQETTGTTADDDSDNGYDGTYNAFGANPATTTGPNSYLTSGIDFDGSSESVSLDIDSLVAGGGARTYSLWGKTPATFDTAAADVVFQVGDGGSPGEAFQAQWEDAAFSLAFNGCRLITPKSVLSTETWYHVTVVIPDSDSSNAKIYIDGVDQTLSLEAGGHLTIDTPLSAGDYYLARNVAGNYLPGALASWKTNDRAFSASEVAQDYDGPEPENTATPTISGTETEDETLTCSSGTWALPSPFASGSNGTITYSYQWTRSDDNSGTNEANISGATNSTYTLVTADVGKYLRCYVRATNDGGYDAAEDTATAFTGAIAAAGVGSPWYYYQQQAILAGV